MKTVNLKFLELCDEIDFWKDQSKYFEKMANEYKKKFSDLLDENLKHSNALDENLKHSQWLETF